MDWGSRCEGKGLGMEDRREILKTSTYRACESSTSTGSMAERGFRIKGVLWNALSRGLMHPFQMRAVEGDG